MQVLQWHQQLRTYRADPTHHACPAPLLMLIHGGAGVGKSHFARNLLSCLPRGVVRCLAPTGVAASELVDGRTVHGFLRLHTHSSGSTAAREARGVSASNIQALATDLENVDVLLFDEISMTSAQLLLTMHNHLGRIQPDKRDLPFAGFGVVCLGDFVQIRPVTGTSVIAAMMASPLNAAGEH